jgi:hypothetical protein
MLVHKFSSYLSFSSKHFHNQNVPTTRVAVRKWHSFKSNASYDMLISLRNKLTCLNGVITLEAVDRLENKLGEIFAFAKTHNYKQGQKYGHLASAISEPKYRLVVGNAMWTHIIPADPGAYSMAALAVGNAATLQVCGRAQDTDEELQ